MTVAELIAALATLPPDLDVYLDSGAGEGSAARVEIITAAWAPAGAYVLVRPIPEHMVV